MSKANNMERTVCDINSDRIEVLEHKIDVIYDKFTAMEARLDKLETGLQLLAMYYGLDLLVRPAVQTTNDYLFVDPAADFKDGKDSKGNKRKPKTDSNGNRKVRKPV